MKLKALAISGIIGISLFGLTTGVAAETAAIYDTEANINFNENEDITLPVDPEDPDTEVTPEVDEDGDDPIEEGTVGPLSIDYASHINFGVVTKSGNAKTYTANPITFEEGDDKRAPYVQVTDSRGTKVGWKLQVSQDGQFSTEGDAELTGAVLTLENGEVRSNSTTDNVLPSDIVFDPEGETHTVMTADAGSGAGTFTDQFGKVVEDKATDVSLFVPGDLVIEDGKYSTTLNWVLEDTP